MSYTLLFFTIGLMMSTLVLGDDCPYEECLCSDTEIQCNDEALTAMPHKFFNENKFGRLLKLDGNQITTIPAGSLPANLSGIFLQKNPIRTIDETAFNESISTLHILFFSEARFTQIPDAVFHLKALNNLQIDQTMILNWNEDGMKQLGSTLQTLSLTSVGLSSWPTWLKLMTNLTELTISECSISTIPDDALDMMASSLIVLDLSSIGLTALPKSMSEMTVLSMLSLNYNKIIDVTWLPQLSSLQTLYLYGNKITDAQQVSNALRSSSHTLNSFDIHNNSLTSIPDLSLLTQMRLLNFEMNHITDANSGSLPVNLTELDLNNNLLSSIPSFTNNLTFLAMLFLSYNNIQAVQGNHIPISVQILDLSFNSISQLTLESFPYNSSLNYLNLNNNPLSTISSDAFNNLSFLEQLNLQRTKLTRLPIVLASLTKLFLFDVTDSANLLCTCQEQSLRPWIESMGVTGVIGDCGMTSVYIFFTALSRECPQIA